MRLMGVFTLWLWIACGASAELLFVVNAPRGSDEAKRWQGLADYLAHSLGQPLQLQGRSPSAVSQLLEQGIPNIALANPVAAVTAVDSGRYVALCTLKRRGASYFAGVLITHPGSGLRTVQDIRQRDVLAYRQGTSGGGFVFPYYYLLQQGIVPRRDLRSFREAQNQEDIVRAVAAGTIDAGMVRSGLLEAMEARGMIKPGQVQVLDERQDTLADRHTTPLYPEWMLLVRKDFSAEAQARAQRALLALKPVDAATIMADVDGFAPPQDLSEVRKAMHAVSEAEAEVWPASRRNP